MRGEEIAVHNVSRRCGVERLAGENVDESVPSGLTEVACDGAGLDQLNQREARLVPMPKADNVRLIEGHHVDVSHKFGGEVLDFLLIRDG